MDAGAVEVEGIRLPAALVTGEAVELELRPASFASRLLALLVDLLVAGVALFVAGLVATQLLFAVDSALGAAIGLVLGLAVLVGSPVAQETVTRGRTLGKLALGLRVVRDDGGPIRFRQALVRGLLLTVEVYSAPFLALVCSLASPRGKRLGDVLAGTYVIRARTRAVLPPVGMPPHLAAWAVGADIGRLPDPLALAARHLVVRAGALHPQAREQLTVQVASAVARHVQPPPPGGVDPLDYLAAVLAERRRRDLLRLGAREDALTRRRARAASAGPLSPGSSRLVGEGADH